VKTKNDAKELANELSSNYAWIKSKSLMKKASKMIKRLDIDNRKLARALAKK